MDPREHISVEHYRYLNWLPVKQRVEKNHSLSCF